MARSPFRFRGVKTYIDTSEKAEWDMAGFQVPESARTRLANRLLATPYSSQDRVTGDVRIRELEGYEVLFSVIRVDRDLVITIGGLEPIDENARASDALESMNLVATIRGALGI